MLQVLKNLVWGAVVCMWRMVGPYSSWLEQD